MLRNNGQRLGTLGFLVCVALILACGPAPDASKPGERANDESNDIRIVVDGSLKKTWSVSELMRGRFDWESPKKKISPAVPVSFVLFSEEGGLAKDAIRGVSIAGRKGRLDLAGDSLPLLEKLLLRLDLKRGGAWQLVGRDLDAERRIASLTGKRHLERIDRIEISMGDDMAAALSAVPVPPDERDIILSTTTSTQDSGLLDELIPRFQKTTGYRVKTIAVGTGEALAMGKRGDADVVLAHAPALERESIEGGFTINRRLVMHNDFLIIGPPEDAAGVGGMKNAAEALRKITVAKARFASRGDNSGTHFRETNLWKKIGITPKGDWYIETGQGMGATLLIASEKGAYTLSDRATFLALRRRSQLVPLVQGDPLLLNIYSVMEVNPERFPKVNNAGAKAFADFLLSDETQALIKTYGVEKFGEPLFFPDAGKSEEALGG